VAAVVLLAAVLLVVVFLPFPGPAVGGPAQHLACQGRGCSAEAASAQRWVVPLSGAWSAGTRSGGSGDGGTVPAFGQAYVAVGDAVAVIGTGLSLTGYAQATGKLQWRSTIDAPGWVIMSVRAWQGVVTVGLLAPAGDSRTEVVLDALTGTELRRYPAAVSGGAVAASTAAAVVVGPTAVTSYDNATGRVRWQRKLTASQSWRTDGRTLYVAESAGGAPGSSAVTTLKVIDLTTGAQQLLSSPVGNPFSGTLAIAADGAVLFASADGVTAYSESTGGVLWSMRGAVPEGTDPAARLDYVTAGNGALVGVDPVTGTVRTSVSAAAVAASAGIYVVRDGIALGLASGANGEAWGYDVHAGRVAWNSPALPWPHFFSDVSGLGGSAAVSGDLVVVTACARMAASSDTCADPELVAFTL
jgi:PQQ-like domain